MLNGNMKNKVIHQIELQAMKMARQQKVWPN